MRCADAHILLTVLRADAIPDSDRDDTEDKGDESMKQLVVKAGLLALASVLAVAGTSALVAQRTPVAPAASSVQPAKPVFSPDGTVHVPAFDLPPSSLLSPEALAAQKARAAMPMMDRMSGVSITDLRAMTERGLAPRVAEMRARYAVDIVEQQMAGVRTRVVTPKAGEADASRVLINLHGGAFMMCAEGCAMVESIPIAAVGRYKVVTVDYRQGPENVFPAASQDVASVYQELLKSYRPENIGIYGCSAGGSLTAQSVAWFNDKHIPMPGAVGIFGAGGVRFGAGDSAYMAGYVDASFPPPGPDGSTIPLAYFKGVAMSERLVSPAAYLDIAAKFPPTLLITGTRAMDMSPAIYTNNQLLKAGVNSRLIVGEGMGHCYIYQAALPEARDAYDQIVRFFDANLGGKGNVANNGNGPLAPAPVRMPAWSGRRTWGTPSSRFASARRVAWIEGFHSSPSLSWGEFREAGRRMMEGQVRDGWCSAVAPSTPRYASGPPPRTSSERNLGRWRAEEGHCIALWIMHHRHRAAG